MSFLFSLHDAAGDEVLAICDGLPDRDILDILDEETMRASTDPDDCLGCPMVRAQPGEAVDCLEARDWPRDEMEISAELSSVLPGLPVREWGSEEAAVMSVYSAILTNPESSIHATDNYFLWDLWRAWHLLQNTPRGILSQVLNDRAEVVQGEPLNLWGVKGSTAGSPFYYGLCLDSELRSLRLSGSDEDTLRLMTGLEPNARIAIRSQEGGPNQALAERVFGAGMPELVAMVAGEEIVPSIPLLRGLTLALVGLQSMAAHDFPEGVPDSPSVSFTNSYGEIPEEAVVWAYSESEVTDFLKKR